MEYICVINVTLIIFVIIIIIMQAVSWILLDIIYYVIHSIKLSILSEITFLIPFYACVW